MCAARKGGEPRTLPKTKTDLMLRSAFLFSAWCAVPSHTQSRIMKSTTSLPGIRVRAENPNHHLWNNHGTWFLHYTVHPTPFTKERIRRSLGTKDIKVARARRDSFFAHLASEASKPVAAATVSMRKAAAVAA
jgi:hypothetical protein